MWEIWNRIHCILHSLSPEFVSSNDYRGFSREKMAIKYVNVFSIAVNRVATFKELDAELVRHTGFLSLV